VRDLSKKKHLKNVGPIRHCEPPDAHSPGVASGTVARRLRIDNDDDNDNDNAWQKGPQWPHGMGPSTNSLLTGTIGDITLSCYAGSGGRLPRRRFGWTNISVRRRGRRPRPLHYRQRLPDRILIELAWQTARRPVMRADGSTARRRNALVPGVLLEVGLPCFLCYCRAAGLELLADRSATMWLYGRFKRCLKTFLFRSWNYGAL